MNSKPVKIAVIGTVGLPANYGGFETLTSHLVKELGQRCDFTVYCSGKKYPRHTRHSSYMGARLKYIPLQANGVQSILYDAWSILNALFYADVLLVLGVAGAWVLPFVRLFSRKKIIISVDGIEWKRDKWNPLAKMYLWWAEKIAVRYSHIDISDNESIQDYTAERYKTLSRIVEYGGDHAKPVTATTEDLERYHFLKYLYAVKVCRIEPENNVHLVLEAFTQVHNRQLVIVGNWNNSVYGKQLKNKYREFENIHLLDPIYDERTINLIRSNAFLYVHGHSAGGTNPSLVEAMSLGLPVLAFGVSYNRTTTENKALYFSSSQEIVDQLRLNNLHSFKEQAKLMQTIAQRRYTWANIALKYESMVHEVLQKNTEKQIKCKVVANLQEKDLLFYEAAHLKHALDFFEKRDTVQP